MALRVSQLDSLRMEGNIARILLQRGLEILQQGGNEQRALPQIAVHFFLWFMTVWRGKPTPGMRLQNLKHANGEALDERERWIRNVLLTLGTSSSSSGKGTGGRTAACTTQQRPAADYKQKYFSLDLTTRQRVLFLLFTLAPAEAVFDFATKLIVRIRRWILTEFHRRKRSRVSSSGRSHMAGAVDAEDDDEYVQLAKGSSEVDDSPEHRPEDEQEAEDLEFQRRLLVSKTVDWWQAVNFFYYCLFLGNCVRHVTLVHWLLQIRFVPLQVGAKRLMAEDHMCLMMLFSHSSSMLLELLPLVDLRACRRTVQRALERAATRWAASAAGRRYAQLTGNAATADATSGSAAGDEMKQADAVAAPKSPPAAPHCSTDDMDVQEPEALTVAAASPSRELSHGGSYSVRTRDSSLIARWGRVLWPGTRALNSTTTGAAENTEKRESVAVNKEDAQPGGKTGSSRPQRTKHVTPLKTSAVRHSGDWSCAVCGAARIVGLPVVVEPCGHRFCYYCFYSEYSQRPVCPQCNEKVDACVPAVA